MSTIPDTILYQYPIERNDYKWPTFSDAEFKRRHQIAQHESLVIQIEWVRAAGHHHHKRRRALRDERIGGSLHAHVGPLSLVGVRAMQ